MGKGSNETSNAPETFASQLEVVQRLKAEAKATDLELSAQEEAQKVLLGRAAALRSRLESSGQAYEAEMQGISEVAAKHTLALEASVELPKKASEIADTDEDIWNDRMKMLLAQYGVGHKGAGSINMLEGKNIASLYIESRKKRMATDEKLSQIAALERYLDELGTVEAADREKIGKLLDEIEHGTFDGNLAVVAEPFQTEQKGIDDAREAKRKEAALLKLSTDLLDAKKAGKVEHSAESLGKLNDALTQARTADPQSKAPESMEKLWAAEEEHAKMAAVMRYSVRFAQRRVSIARLSEMAERGVEPEIRQKLTTLAEDALKKYDPSGKTKLEDYLKEKAYAESAEREMEAEDHKLKEDRKYWQAIHTEIKTQKEALESGDKSWMKKMKFTDLSKKFGTEAYTHEVEAIGAILERLPKGANAISGQQRIEDYLKKDKELKLLERDRKLFEKYKEEYLASEEYKKGKPHVPDVKEVREYHREKLAEEKAKIKQAIDAEYKREKEHIESLEKIAKRMESDLAAEQKARQKKWETDEAKKKKAAIEAYKKKKEFVSKYMTDEIRKQGEKLQESREAAEAALQKYNSDPTHVSDRKKLQDQLAAPRPKTVASEDDKKKIDTLRQQLAQKKEALTQQRDRERQLEQNDERSIEFLLGKERESREKRYGAFLREDKDALTEAESGRDFNKFLAKGAMFASHMTDSLTATFRVAITSALEADQRAKLKDSAAEADQAAKKSTKLARNMAVLAERQADQGSTKRSEELAQRLTEEREDLEDQYRESVAELKDRMDKLPSALQTVRERINVGFRLDSLDPKTVEKTRRVNEICDAATTEAGKGASERAKALSELENETNKAAFDAWVKEMSAKDKEFAAELKKVESISKKLSGAFTESAKKKQDLVLDLTLGVYNLAMRCKSVAQGGIPIPDEVDFKGSIDSMREKLRKTDESDEHYMDTMLEVGELAYKKLEQISQEMAQIVIGRVEYVQDAKALGEAYRSRRDRFKEVCKSGAEDTVGKRTDFVEANRRDREALLQERIELNEHAADSVGTKVTEVKKKKAELEAAIQAAEEKLQDLANTPEEKARALKEFAKKVEQEKEGTEKPVSEEMLAEVTAISVKEADLEKYSPAEMLSALTGEEISDKMSADDLMAALGRIHVNGINLSSYYGLAHEYDRLVVRKELLKGKPLPEGKSGEEYFVSEFIDRCGSDLKEALGEQFGKEVAADRDNPVRGGIISCEDPEHGYLYQAVELSGKDEATDQKLRNYNLAGKIHTESINHEIVEESEKQAKKEEEKEAEKEESAKEESAEEAPEKSSAEADKNSAIPEELQREIEANERELDCHKLAVTTMIRRENHIRAQLRGSESEYREFNERLEEIDKKHSLTLEAELVLPKKPEEITDENAAEWNGHLRKLLDRFGSAGEGYADKDSLSGVNIASVYIESRKARIASDKKLEQLQAIETYLSTLETVKPEDERKIEKLLTELGKDGLSPEALRIADELIATQGEKERGREETRKKIAAMQIPDELLDPQKEDAVDYAPERKEALKKLVEQRKSEGKSVYVSIEEMRNEEKRIKGVKGLMRSSWRGMKHEFDLPTIDSIRESGEAVDTEAMEWVETVTRDALTAYYSAHRGTSGAQDLEDFLAESKRTPMDDPGIKAKSVQLTADREKLKKDKEKTKAARKELEEGKKSWMKDFSFTALSDLDEEKHKEEVKEIAKILNTRMHTTPAKSGERIIDEYLKAANRIKLMATDTGILESSTQEYLRHNPNKKNPGIKEVQKYFEDKLKDDKAAIKKAIKAEYDAELAKVKQSEEKDTTQQKKLDADEKALNEAKKKFRDAAKEKQEAVNAHVMGKLAEREKALETEKKGLAKAVEAYNDSKKAERKTAKDELERGTGKRQLAQGVSAETPDKIRKLQDKLAEKKETVQAERKVDRAIERNNERTVEYLVDSERKERESRKKEMLAMNKRRIKDAEKGTIVNRAIAKGALIAANISGLATDKFRVAILAAMEANEKARILDQQEAVRKGKERDEQAAKDMSALANREVWGGADRAAYAGGMEKLSGALADERKKLVATHAEREAELRKRLQELPDALKMVQESVDPRYRFDAIKLKDMEKLGRVHEICADAGRRAGEGADQRAKDRLQLLSEIDEESRKKWLEEQTRIDDSLRHELEEVDALSEKMAWAFTEKAKDRMDLAIKVTEKTLNVILKCKGIVEAAQGAMEGDIQQFIPEELDLRGKLEEIKEGLSGEEDDEHYMDALLELGLLAHERLSELNQRMAQLAADKMQRYEDAKYLGEVFRERDAEDKKNLEGYEQDPMKLFRETEEARRNKRDTMLRADLEVTAKAGQLILSDTLEVQEKGEELKNRIPEEARTLDSVDTRKAAEKPVDKEEEKKASEREETEKQEEEPEKGKKEEEPEKSAEELAAIAAQKEAEAAEERELESYRMAVDMMKSRTDNMEERLKGSEAAYDLAVGQVAQIAKDHALSLDPSMKLPEKLSDLVLPEGAEEREAFISKWNGNFGQLLASHGEKKDQETYNGTELATNYFAVRAKREALDHKLEQFAAIEGYIRGLSEVKPEDLETLRKIEASIVDGELNQEGIALVDSILSKRKEAEKTLALMEIPTQLLEESGKKPVAYEAERRAALDKVIEGTYGLKTKCKSTADFFSEEQMIRDIRGLSSLTLRGKRIDLDAVEKMMKEGSESPLFDRTRAEIETALKEYNKKHFYNQGATTLEGFFAEQIRSIEGDPTLNAEKDRLQRVHESVTKEKEAFDRKAEEFKKEKESWMKDFSFTHLMKQKKEDRGEYDREVEEIAKILSQQHYQDALEQAKQENPGKPVDDKRVGELMLEAGRKEIKSYLDRNSDLEQLTVDHGVYARCEQEYKNSPKYQKKKNKAYTVDDIREFLEDQMKEDKKKIKDAIKNDYEHTKGILDERQKYYEAMDKELKKERKELQEEIDRKKKIEKARFEHKREEIRDRVAAQLEAYEQELAEDKDKIRDKVERQNADKLQSDEAEAQRKVLKENQKLPEVAGLAETVQSIREKISKTEKKLSADRDVSREQEKNNERLLGGLLDKEKEKREERAKELSAADKKERKRVEKGMTRNLVMAKGALFASKATGVGLDKLRKALAAAQLANVKAQPMEYKNRLKQQAEDSARIAKNMAVIDERMAHDGMDGSVSAAEREAYIARRLKEKEELAERHKKTLEALEKTQREMPTALEEAKRIVTDRYVLPEGEKDKIETVHRAHEICGKAISQLGGTADPMTKTFMELEDAVAGKEYEEWLEKRKQEDASLAEELEDIDAWSDKIAFLFTDTSKENMDFILDMVQKAYNAGMKLKSQIEDLQGDDEEEEDEDEKDEDKKEDKKDKKDKKEDDKDKDKGKQDEEEEEEEDEEEISLRDKLDELKDALSGDDEPDPHYLDELMEVTVLAYERLESMNQKFAKIAAERLEKYENARVISEAYKLREKKFAEFCKGRDEDILVLRKEFEEMLRRERDERLEKELHACEKAEDHVKKELEAKVTEREERKKKALEAPKEEEKKETEKEETAKEKPKKEQTVQAALPEKLVITEEALTKADFTPAKALAALCGEEITENMRASELLERLGRIRVNGVAVPEFFALGGDLAATVMSASVPAGYEGTPEQYFVESTIEKCGSQLLTAMKEQLGMDISGKPNPLSGVLISTMDKAQDKLLPLELAGRTEQSREKAALYNESNNLHAAKQNEVRAAEAGKTAPAKEAAPLFDSSDLEILEGGMAGMADGKRSEAFQKMLQSVENINNFAKVLNQSGEYMMRSDASVMVALHKNALRDTEAYLAKQGHFKGKMSENGRRRRALAEQTRELLKARLETFEKASEEATMKMDDALRAAGVTMETVTLSAERTGANSSTRSLVKENNVVTGYFTEDNVVTGVDIMQREHLMQQNAAMLERFDKAYGILGIHTSYSRYAKEQKNRIESDKVEAQLSEEKGLYAIIAKEFEREKTLSEAQINEALADVLKEHGFSESKIGKMMNDTEFMNFSRHMVRECWNIEQAMKAQTMGGQGVGVHVARLNVAMSEVADAIGMPELLARSRMVKTTVRDNGTERETTGVLMDAAKGVDKGKPENFQEFSGGIRFGASAYRQINDMAFLDYICGNVDRHSNNMVYQFGSDGKTIVGVQGIDNDLSFSVDNAYSKRGLLYDIANLRYISETAAVNIMAMTGEQLAVRLKGYLTEEQIAKTKERLGYVQEKIRGGEFIALKDEEWEQVVVHPDDLRKDPAHDRQGNSLMKGSVLALSGVGRSRDNGTYSALEVQRDMNLLDLSKSPIDPLDERQINKLPEERKKAYLAEMKKRTDEIQKVLKEEKEREEAAARKRQELEASKEQRVYGVEVNADVLRKYHEIRVQKEAEFRAREERRKGIDTAQLVERNEEIMDLMLAADAAFKPQGVFHKSQRPKEYRDMKLQLADLQTMMAGCARQNGVVGKIQTISSLIDENEKAEKTIRDCVAALERGELDKEQRDVVNRLKAMADKLHEDRTEFYRRPIGNAPKETRNAAESMINLDGKVTEFKGGAVSTRVYIHGEGFFTEDSKNDNPYPAVMAYLEDKLKDDPLMFTHGDLMRKFMYEFRGKAVNRFDLPMKSNLFAALYETHYDPDNEETKDKIYAVMEDMGFSDAEIREVRGSAALQKKVSELVKDTDKILGGYLESRKVEIESGNNIGDRNVAMSKVAALLGEPELLAESRRVTVIDHGVEHSGILMDVAAGTLREDMEEKPVVQMTDNALRQTADMMFLDYICANTDRHDKNISYIMNDGRVIGIQGIDNDMSFGLLAPAPQWDLPPIDTMKYISKGMKEALDNLDETKFREELKGYLTEEEINAAWKRAQYVRDMVEVRVNPEYTGEKMTVLGDDQWLEVVKVPQRMVKNTSKAKSSVASMGLLTEDEAERIRQAEEEQKKAEEAKTKEEEEKRKAAEKEEEEKRKAAEKEEEEKRKAAEKEEEEKKKAAEKEEEEKKKAAEKEEEEKKKAAEAKKKEEGTKTAVSMDALDLAEKKETKAKTRISLEELDLAEHGPKKKVVPDKKHTNPEDSMAAQQEKGSKKPAGKTNGI